MEHDELQHRISELSERTFRTGKLTSTFFLDPSEAAKAHVILRSQNHAKPYFFGGFEDAERTRLFFLPEYIDEEFFPVDEHITALHIKCPFGAPTHRDYLGALMGLGIKRETLGDILVSDGSAYLICTPQISDFIISNFTKVGRFGIKCERCELSDIKIPEPVFDVVSGTVATLRADAVSALAFGISRTSASELIHDGRLSVNHIERPNSASEIREGDLLSLRGFGRAKLVALGGASKKGRQFIELHVFSKK